MKIVFAGTPEFAAQAMRAIEKSGHQIVLALTQPDRRAGRGMHLQASPVKIFAQEKNIPVLQPESLKLNHADLQKRAAAQEMYRYLSGIDFDAMVVVAYGLILPQDILDLASHNDRHGCFNIHASLLPRWRGAAPIQRAIECGDDLTGVSIMQMDAGLDTGDTVLVGDLKIASDETSASLHDRLAIMGAELMVKILNDLDQGLVVTRTPQSTEGVTYAEKILKSEAEIDWQLSAAEIDRRIRAFNPFPGSTSSLCGEQLKFWSSRLSDKAPIHQDAIPGRVVGFSGDGAYVQCGEGVIEILEMQKPGGKRISANLCIPNGANVNPEMTFEKFTNQLGGANV
ncbi:MAG: methionyl-tRNA formyltransferase [Polynucleobacter sp. 24-46-87]|jgi:methionyl-tRNA formyltransferase|uniref:methionyl-tRNA formyltransferase n=1 Tax=unclassified Polynucleobacter TaxID=2640945 RepID=UPI000BD6B6C4|nr:MULTISPECIES: methionyl-tRNA formyltransferase [unclassified Polynucleobacter]OYY21590.1 MAG: methionyl-tRNA formyltransferase [Polynucleobacter sp. 35-46-11]OZA15741.1 MAG: methionyl-tRNA formyltransferase [Polynucleobacter sp. 24-46-87]OZA77758.1 MAG: methionyl-tRNA formyltransferase [Polynucleobacter sp. 39-46-10]